MLLIPTTSSAWKPCSRYWAVPMATIERTYRPGPAGRPRWGTDSKPGSFRSLRIRRKLQRLVGRHP